MTRDEAILQSLNELTIIKERLLQFTQQGVYRKGNFNDTSLGAGLDKLFDATELLFDSVDEFPEGE